MALEPLIGEQRFEECDDAVLATRTTPYGNGPGERIEKLWLPQKPVRGLLDTAKAQLAGTVYLPGVEEVIDNVRGDEYGASRRFISSIGERELRVTAVVLPKGTVLRADVVPSYPKGLPLIASEHRQDLCQTCDYRPSGYAVCENVRETRTAYDGLPKDARRMLDIANEGGARCPFYRAK